MELAKTDRAPEEKKEPGKDGLVRQAIKRFDRVIDAESENRKNAVDDLRFKQGDQWPEAIKADRTTQKRPCLTINKMKTFCHQITNDQRQNRPAINVSPVGDRSDKTTAMMLKGLIKQIERQSNADIAYDTGFDSAVSGGWGYWRVFTDYEDEDTFNQVIRIGRIRNPFRVYIDPDHQEPDGSDAKWGFISELMPREEFRSEFPKKESFEWTESGVGDEYKNWVTQTHIRIAEYFYQEMKSRKLLALANGHIGYEDELAPELKAMIEEQPSLVVKEREVQGISWKWCKLTAKEVLEEQDWPGKWMPIVKVIGDEVDVEGKVTLAGLIRDAKDPQRMYNYWVTAETEQVALMPKAPYIMEEGQVEGHEASWKQANNKNYPYLLYKASNLNGKPAPPPQRQQFAGPPQGVVAAKIAAAQDIQGVTGIRFDATLQERTHNESGRALESLKRTGDLGNYHYVDNLARSLKHTGRILIDLIPKIYDTPRMLTILREDDTEEQVHIDPGLQEPSSRKEDAEGNVKKLFNPKLGRYEVAVTVGPSYATKRQEAAESQINFLKAVPNAGPFIGDLIAKNMDWPGAEEIATRLAAMLPPQVAQALGKDMDGWPTQAKSMVMALQQQQKQLEENYKKAMGLLGDKEADRQIERDKIEVQKQKGKDDFEAKLTAVAADMQTALLQVHAQEQQDNTAQLEKVAKDFEAKIVGTIADMETERLKREQEAQLAREQMASEERLAQQQQAQDSDLASQEGDRQERIAGEDRKSSEKTTLAGAKQKQKPAEKASMVPQIHVHVGGNGRVTDENEKKGPSKKRGHIGGRPFEIVSEGNGKKGHIGGKPFEMVSE